MTSLTLKTSLTCFRAMVLFLLSTILLSCNKSDDDTKSTSSNTNQQSVDVPIDTSDNNENQGAIVNDLSDITHDFAELSAFYRWEGAQVAITRNGKLVYLESFGKADVQENTTIDRKSLFRVAGISKPITVVAISKLVSQNKLSLDEKVFGQNSILGNVFGTPPYEPVEESITVKQLLEHRAGFANVPNDIMFADTSLSHADLIGKVLDERTLTHEPDAEFEYSNFGYSLLGRIIEKRTGMTYEDYVKNEILAPMTIDDMHIARNEKRQKFENEVSYYSTWSSPYDLNVSRMDSHGGWVGSAISLAKFALRVDGHISVPDFLEPNERLVYMTGQSWAHNGSLPGSLAIMRVNYPTSYIVLLNKGNADFTAIARVIREFMDDKISERSNWPTDDLFELH